MSTALKAPALKAPLFRECIWRWGNIWIVCFYGRKVLWVQKESFNQLWRNYCCSYSYASSYWWKRVGFN